MKKSKEKEKENAKKLTGKAQKRKVSYKNSARELINDFKETFKAFKTDDVGTNNINIQEIDDLKDGIKQVEKLEKEYYGIEKDKKEVNFGIERKNDNKSNSNNNNNIESKEYKEHKEGNILDKLINKTNKVKSTNEIFNKKIEEKKKERKNTDNTENKNKSLEDMLKKLEENEKKNEEIQKKIIETEDDIDNI